MGLVAAQTRYRALLAYDGTAYCGFQRQRQGTPTVQGELERVLMELARCPVTVTGAGRTDSGVHARGQVISFTIEWRHDEDALQRALNANLPDDIAVRGLEATVDTFHPRFDARWRSYAYYVYPAPVRSPLYHRYSWHVVRQLRLEPMNEAAQLLVGKRDFATFGLPPQGDSTVRELVRAEWQQERPFLVFSIEANAFLYRMVRSIVGSLVAVGSGAWSIDNFAAALVAADRNRSAAAAPPQGLFLTSVTY